MVLLPYGSGPRIITAQQRFFFAVFISGKRVVVGARAVKIQLTHFQWQSGTVPLAGWPGWSLGGQRQRGILI